MSNYKLDTINDKEFENLIRDLFQKEHKLLLESFKTGADGGIDLRYTKPVDSQDTLIIQAKHWTRTSFQQLFRYLEKKELPKVKKINPERYVLAIAQGLTPKNKEDIISIFKPYIKSPSDIIDLELINNLLGKYPEIEKKHYKLWLSSIEIMQNILNNAVIGRAEYQEQIILQNIKKFVPNKKYSESVEIINNKKLLIITGEPGIGKTITSEMIIYDFLAKGFQLVKIDDSFRDAEAVFGPKESKQLFYFDDFLGTNYLAILNPINTDSTITSFINRVLKTKNKYMILTTRTTILAQAKENFEKLNRAKLDPSEHEIKIEDYSLFQKGYILYNHLCFSDLSEVFKDEIIKNKNYWKIIKHPNFNPRIVEFITEAKNIETQPDNYLKNVLFKFDNPSLIWEFAYLKQIDDYGRLFLQTLFSFNGKANEEEFQTAFDHRLKYEVKEHGREYDSVMFYTKMKELLGGFITRTMKPNEEIEYKFFNPSISDFFIHYFNNHKKLKWDILNSAIYVEQITNVFSAIDDDRVLISENEIGDFLELIDSKSNKLLMTKQGSKRLEILYFLVKQFESKSVFELLEKIYQRLDIENISFTQRGKLSGFLQIASDIENLKNFTISNWDEIVDKLIMTFLMKDDIMVLNEIFDLYEMSYENYISREEAKSNLQEQVDNVWERTMDYEITKATQEDYEYVQVAESLAELKNDLSRFNNTLKLKPSKAFEDIDSVDLDDIVQSNRDDAEAADQYANSLDGQIPPSSGRSEESMVDDLFSR